MLDDELLLVEIDEADDELCVEVDSLLADTDDSLLELVDCELSELPELTDMLEGLEVDVELFDDSSCTGLLVLLAELLLVSTDDREDGEEDELVEMELAELLEWLLVEIDNELSELADTELADIDESEDADTDERDETLCDETD